MSLKPARATCLGLGATIWLLGAASPASQLALDCRSQTQLENDETFAGKFKLLPPPDRRRCLGELLALANGTDQPILVQYAARTLVTLADQRLIENDPAVLPPLIACVQRDLLQLGIDCNRALMRLTRHDYGDRFFSPILGLPEVFRQSRADVVNDWTKLARALERGHPIFDASLANLCTRAVRTIAGLVHDALAPLRAHAIRPYLEGVRDDAAPRLGNDGWIYEFSLGHAPGFPLPGNWHSTDELRGLRFQISRPGIKVPAALPPDVIVTTPTIPIADADYRELFPALDLEVRFQILTTRDDLRRATAAALRDALSELRTVEATLRR